MDKLLPQELCVFSYAVVPIHVTLIVSVLTKISHKIIVVKIKQGNLSYRELGCKENLSLAETFYNPEDLKL
jgi:hypothetical protein